MKVEWFFSQRLSLLCLCTRISIRKLGKLQIQKLIYRKWMTYTIHHLKIRGSLRLWTKANSICIWKHPNKLTFHPSRIRIISLEETKPQWANMPKISIYPSKTNWVPHSGRDICLILETMNMILIGLMRNIKNTRN